MAHDISQGQNYRCYKYSFVNISYLKIKAPSIILEEAYMFSYMQ